LSTQPLLTLIAVISADGCISTGTGVPWRLPRDQEHFRAATRGQWLLLGRRTYEEMLGWFKDHRPLVLTRNAAYLPPVGQPVASVQEALRLAAEGGVAELFVCGGGDTYAAAMPYADRLLLTHVDAELGGGVPFPEVDPAVWQMTEHEDFPADAMHAHGLRFATYERCGASRKQPAAQL
jgi:dihydrofolate reductase